MVKAIRFYAYGAGVWLCVVAGSAAALGLGEIQVLSHRDAGVSIFKMVRALYNRNPHAFGGGMDMLKQGVMLQIPTSDKLAGVDVDNKPVAMAVPAERNEKLGTVPGSEKPKPVEQQVSHESEIQNAGQGPRLSIVKAEADEETAADATNRVDQSSTDINTPEQISDESEQIKQRLYPAEHELEALRKDNHSMWASMVQLQNQLLLTQTRLDQLLSDFQILVEATQASPAEAMPLPETPPLLSDWLHWLLRLAVAGLFGGLAMIYWRKWRGQNTLFRSRRSVREGLAAVNLDEILDSVQDIDEAHQASSGHEKRMTRAETFSTMKEFA